MARDVLDERGSGTLLAALGFALNEERLDWAATAAAPVFKGRLPSYLRAAASP